MSKHDERLASIAQWMMERINKGDQLYQYEVVDHLESTGMHDLVLTNDNGNPAIAPSVLKAFRGAGAHTVVWVSSERYWRLREAGDQPGRRAQS